MTPENEAAARYFRAIAAALEGLSIYMRDDRGSLYRDGTVAPIVAAHLARLEASFSCWEHRLSFMQSFRISRAESGYPVFQNLLELENDRGQAETRLTAIPAAEELRGEMVDFILRRKEFPAALQRSMAERLYLEQLKASDLFTPFTLAKTAGVSVNPKTRRPVYLVHWAAFDGSANLPLIYMATVEDSSPAMVRQLVAADGTLQAGIDIPLPVDGLLNPELAFRFDDFTQKNAAYTLSPATIAGNLDKDFAGRLHPKLLRRVVLGPFYSAGITENNSRVAEILSRVRRAENAWLFTWTVQEIYSKGETPGRQGFFSSEPGRQEFYINTDDLEAARQGVSFYENHALLPHEAYQALYAEGESRKVFEGYQVHILSKGQVISDV